MPCGSFTCFSFGTVFGVERETKGQPPCLGSPNLNDPYGRGGEFVVEANVASSFVARVEGIHPSARKMKPQDGLN